MAKEWSVVSEEPAAPVAPNASAGNAWNVVSEEPATAAPAPAPIVKASAPVAAPTPTSAPLAYLGSPMGESLGTEITNVAQPKPVSVLQGKQLPPTAPTCLLYTS